MASETSLALNLESVTPVMAVRITDEAPDMKSINKPHFTSRNRFTVQIDTDPNYFLHSFPCTFS
jgi:hypothetical protein